MVTTAPEPQVSDRLAGAIAEEEYRALRLAARVRAGALLAVGVWLAFENPFPEVLYYHGVILLFAGLGLVPVILHRSPRRRDFRWLRYLFPVLDVGLLTVVVLVPNPLESDTVLTAPMRLRSGNELYLVLFVCVAVFSYSPRLVLWTGIVACLAWSAGALWTLALPASRGLITADMFAAMSPESIRAALVHPQQVDVGRWIRHMVVVLTLAAGLATYVHRARRLVLRQAHAERARANLSRYFSANMVEELAGSDEPLRRTRTQPCAVLFADLVGFTSLCAHESPERVVTLLREFHGRMQLAVFDHGGTLDKYIGDGVMATFGTPRPGLRDATNALRCVRAMVGAITAWNADRVARGQTPVRMGIGAHYGPVVIGDIGGEQRLELAVIGDTVNVASRLERVTRERGAVVVVSDALVDAARHEPGADGHLDASAVDAVLTGFTKHTLAQLRGRDRGIHVWVLGDSG
jgi:adenylate cyclase